MSLERFINAEKALDAVERWAAEWILVRQLGDMSLKGRYDGLLLPACKRAHCMMKPTTTNYWLRPRIVGVEVKVSRADFLRGLKGKQYERYAEGVAGLFVAAPRTIFKKEEIPPHVGILAIRGVDGEERYRATCVRYPTYRDIEVDVVVMWRLVFRAYDMLQQWKRNQRGMSQRFRERLGELSAAKLFSPIDRIVDQARAEAAK